MSFSNQFVSFTDNTREVYGAFNYEAYQRLNAMGGAALKKISADMDSSRGGKMNKRGHIASAPYENPAIEFSDLVTSLEYEVSMTTVSFVLSIGTASPVAIYVEFGHGDVAERPFLTHYELVTLQYHVALFLTATPWITLLA